MPSKKIEGETDTQKFEREANIRTDVVIKGLNVLAQLGKAVPDDAYIEAVFGPIRDTLNKALAHWKARTSPGRPRVFALNVQPDPRQLEVPTAKAATGKAK